MTKEAKTINLTISPEVYRDLRNIAVIRMMTGAMGNSVADEFLVKLCRVIDSGAQSFEFKYKDPNYDASLPDGKGLAVEKKCQNTDEPCPT